MELNSNEVLKVIERKGVIALHHANTVQTACTFLRQGRLMGRGVVADRRLSQTAQQTDELDKKYGIWNDVFLDGIDIHERARGRCFYGPVLFVFDVKLLAQDLISTVWVSRKNPQSWTDEQGLSDRYFNSVADLQHDYKKTKFDFSIMLRSVGGVVRLKPFLKEIILDALPYSHLFNQALGALKASARSGGMTNLSINPRRCARTCQCPQQYKNMTKPVLEKFFGP